MQYSYVGGGNSMPRISDTVSFEEIRVDRRTVNGPLNGSRNATMLSVIGNPRGQYDQECRSPTNQQVANLMVTEDVGPFRATGLKPAVNVLREILSDVKQERLDIYSAMSSAGMLCCRYVRGSATTISNHSWGTAIDLKLEGKLDRRGDGRTQRGLLEIAPIFNRHRFFWGAAFPTEDSMHFEASEELILDWAAQGLFGAAGVAAGTRSLSILTFGDRGPKVEDLQRRLTLALAMDIAIDGIFGRDTRAAVIEFQRRNELTTDGVVGRATWDRLLSLGG